MGFIVVQYCSLISPCFVWWILDSHFDVTFSLYQTHLLLLCENGEYHPLVFQFKITTTCPTFIFSDLIKPETEALYGTHSVNQLFNYKSMLDILKGLIYVYRPRSREIIELVASVRPSIRLCVSVSVCRTGPRVLSVCLIRRHRWIISRMRSIGFY